MFCQKCGAELLEDARFCISCGTKIEQSAAPIPSFADLNIDKANLNEELIWPEVETIDLIEETPPVPVLDFDKEDVYENDLTEDDMTEPILEYVEEATVFMPMEQPFILTLTAIDEMDYSEKFVFDKKDVCVVGRSRKGTDILINGQKEISNRHCQIEKEGEEFFIKDLGSTNGTFVEEEKKDERTQIEDGSLVRLGKITFKVSITKG